MSFAAIDRDIAYLRRRIDAPKRKLHRELAIIAARRVAEPIANHWNPQGTTRPLPRRPTLHRRRLPLLRLRPPAPKAAVPLSQPAGLGIGQGCPSLPIALNWRRQSLHELRPSHRRLADAPANTVTRHPRR